MEDLVVVDQDTLEAVQKAASREELTPGRKFLQSLINRNFRIVMTDGRILIGPFLCTDKDANVILGVCSEYMKEGEESRMLGLVMVPGRHIVSIEADMASNPQPSTYFNSPRFDRDCDSD